MKRIPATRCNPCPIELALRSPSAINLVEDLNTCFQSTDRCHQATELTQAALALLPPNQACELREEYGIADDSTTMSRSAVARVMETSPAEIREIEEKFVARMAFARAEHLLAARD